MRKHLLLYVHSRSYSLRDYSHCHVLWTEDTEAI